MAAPAAPGLRVVFDHPLPEPLAKARDVRWAGPGAVLLAAGHAGTLEVPLGPNGLGAPKLLVASLPQSGLERFHSRLGASPQFLLMASPVFSTFWHPRSSADPGEVQTSYRFEAIIDLDLAGDRLLLLGAQKDEQGRFAPDGAIAWTARLGKDLTEVKPLLRSTAGAGARPMDACGLMELGKVRFLRDGSLLVAPGVEPGVFRYTQEGRLVQTWQAEALGFDAGCGISDDEMYRFSASMAARYPWINQRRVLDEVLPLPDGPGFVVRTRSAGKTTWQLKVPRGGKVDTYAIPVSSSEERSHLRGDVRDGRIVLLLLDQVTHPPAGSARLLVLEVPAAPASSGSAKSKPTRH